MDPRNQDPYLSLSERVSAQIESYVEMSNALVKMIEQIADIRDRQRTANTDADAEFKALHSRIQDVIHELEKVRALLEKENLSSNLSATHNMEKILDSLTLISKKIDVQTKDFADFKNSNNKLQTFVWVFTVIALILGFLSSAHLVSISWLPK